MLRGGGLALLLHRLSVLLRLGGLTLLALLGLAALASLPTAPVSAVLTLIGAIAALNWVCGAWFTLCEMEVALCAAF